ncbi:uncharacterized protein DFL_005129 [Arthrobotrys flagrans]|uniref:Uncharacterized protein n=1 Tax=Arthrobotrys flagrans TaxID=97331 RepID=A0A437A6Y9_ARTFL|nr:hypothetical protein DFL_005129 [Arthrobotrys flagrans]
MKISNFIVVPFLIPAVLSAPLANTGLGIYKRLSQGIYQSKILRRAPNPDAPEPGVMKKLLFETPVVEALDPEILKVLEAMPDAVFDKLSTVTSDKFLAYLDALLAGKIPE